MDPFTHRFRVRYAELDPQAVVFNSRYLEYADILVTEFFRSAHANGMPQDLEFHVRRAEVDFLKPIRADEEIEGQLTIDRIGNSSMAMTISLDGAGGGPADRRAIVTLLQVHVDLASGQPLRIPDALRTAFGFELEGAAHG
ncbi:acyl-CoA thioesterase [Erythrobacter sp. W53]|uniref:acyl-CoA thioesterase n=1 Tax=Erythrobacter sp. W53 TaxID=3425947 RepID=UPI003D76836A